MATFNLFESETSRFSGLVLDADDDPVDLLATNCIIVFKVNSDPPIIKDSRDGEIDLGSDGVFSFTIDPEETASLELHMHRVKRLKYELRLKDNLGEIDVLEHGDILVYRGLISHDEMSTSED